MTRIRVFGSMLLLVAGVALMSVTDAAAASRGELDRDGSKALQRLYSSNAAARKLGEKAVAVLVFPNIVKAGFLFGGQIGEGVLFKGGKPAGYYNSVAASYGLQAGIQTFGYALFFMNDARARLSRRERRLGARRRAEHRRRRQGVGKSLTSTTLTQDVYAFIFNQKGLMARHRRAGLEDHQDLQVAGGALEQKGANAMSTHICFSLAAASSCVLSSAAVRAAEPAAAEAPRSPAATSCSTPSAPTARRWSP